ncbi:hypothetical protein, partial [Companilactobacillus zhongbaensis]|uniref:hypothetical protein n=1 Tax=Companilactobacillus zhongbaensis TaxID=2486009 RepID=UPI001CDCB086
CELWYSVDASRRKTSFIVSVGTPMITDFSVLVFFYSDFLKVANLIIKFAEKKKSESARETSTRAKNKLLETNK